jgi:hypothetical protein
VIPETSVLLTALNMIDEIMAEVMLGLLQDTLSPDAQVRFGRSFRATGKMLERHAELMRLPTRTG